MNPRHELNRKAMAERLARWIIDNGQGKASGDAVRGLSEKHWTWIAAEAGEKRVPSPATQLLTAATVDRETGGVPVGAR